MRSIWKIGSMWAFAGAVVPLVMMLLFGLLAFLLPASLVTALDGFRQTTELLVWPTSFWLMAGEGAGLAATIEIVAIAVFANCVIYFVIGLLLTTGWRVARSFAGKHGLAGKRGSAEL